jgi:hypothetical protein
MLFRCCLAITLHQQQTGISRAVIVHCHDQALNCLCQQLKGMIMTATSDDNYQLNAVADLPDIRDLVYQPALIPVKDTIGPPEDLIILDQGREGACTGFGLAATINFLYQKKYKEESAHQHKKIRQVSARMLYEMARKFDEWPGESYSGSSCRGAMRGWQNMGVCTDSSWPYISSKTGTLTIERAKQARQTTPGAYYRLAKRIEDYHTALNEVGIIYASAHVHKGWYKSQIKKGKIPYQAKRTGGHAFALVGYNDEGFWVQNSWSENWGNSGLALWSYKDWHENITDGWVVQLAVPTPDVWASKTLRGDGTAGRAEFGFFKSPRRNEISGHFVHLDDGNFHDSQKYFSSYEDVQQTADLIKKSRHYQHLLLYAHGGLNSPKASAKRIAAMKNTFKQNGIYPYHFMYDTGLLEELKDVILRHGRSDEGRAEGAFDWLSDHWDRVLENATRIPGRALWREMKRGASLPFKTNKAGSKTLSAMIPAALQAGMKIHLVGHSTGAILMGQLISQLKNQHDTLKIQTCSLMAPACTNKDFDSLYADYLQTSPNQFGIKNLSIYNLSEELEKDDTVGGVYRKSLLYLVSKAFEEERPTELLGMKKYNGNIDQQNLSIHYSTGKRGKITGSTSHVDFDNDPATMNHILKRVLGKTPKVIFTKANLDY